MIRVRVRVRVKLGVGLGLGFRSGQSQCVPLFCSVNYHILVKSETRRSRSVPPFRSVPEIITTRKLQCTEIGMMVIPRESCSNGSRCCGTSAGMLKKCENEDAFCRNAAATLPSISGKKNQSLMSLESSSNEKALRGDANTARWP